MVSLPDGLDYLIKPHKENICPLGKQRAQREAKRFLDLAFDRGLSEFKQMSLAAQREFGLDKAPDFKAFKKLSDSLISDSFHRRERAQFDASTETGQYILNIHTVNHFLPLLDETYLRLILRRFAQELVDRLRSAEQSLKEGRPPKKLLAYGVHDSNISPFLIFFGILDYRCNLRQIASRVSSGCMQKPPYAANLIFELVRNTTSQQLFVRFRYNGEYYDICSGGVAAKGRGLCALDKLIGRLEAAALSEAEVKRYCGVPPESSGIPESLRWPIALLGVVVCYLIYKIWYYKKRADERLALLRKVVKEQ